MLEFKVMLPPPKVSDIVSRELTVAVGSADPVVRTMQPADVEATGFSGEENDPVTATLIDIDNVGNRSEARVSSTTLVDTIAPPQPGEMGFAVTAES